MVLVKIIEFRLLRLDISHQSCDISIASLKNVLCLHMFCRLSILNYNILKKGLR